VFEGPTDTLKALAQPLSERMCRSSALTVPLVAEPGLGDNWDASHG